MISAQIKRICTQQMDDLEDCQLADPEAFCVVVRVMAGPRGEPGEESFDVKVCSPRWLEQQIKIDGFVIGRHYLVVDFFDPSKIKKILTKFFERHTGDSWTEIAEKLGRNGLWEFES